MLFRKSGSGLHAGHRAGNLSDFVHVPVSTCKTKKKLKQGSCCNLAFGWAPVADHHEAEAWHLRRVAAEAHGVAS